MLELSKPMRQMMIDQIDDNFGHVGEDGAPEEYAEAVVDAIESVADEFDEETGDEIVSHLEASGELDGSLVDTLALAFEEDPEYDYIGEKVMAALERMCHISWREEASVDMFALDDEF